MEQFLRPQMSPLADPHVSHISSLALDVPSVSRVGQKQNKTNNKQQQKRTKNKITKAINHRALKRPDMEHISLRRDSWLGTGMMG